MGTCPQCWLVLFGLLGMSTVSCGAFQVELLASTSKQKATSSSARALVAPRRVLSQHDEDEGGAIDSTVKGADVEGDGAMDSTIKGADEVEDSAMDSTIKGADEVEDGATDATLKGTESGEDDVIDGNMQRGDEGEDGTIDDTKTGGGEGEDSAIDGTARGADEWEDGTNDGTVKGGDEWEEGAVKVEDDGEGVELGKDQATVSADVQVEMQLDGGDGSAADIEVGERWQHDAEAPDVLEDQEGDEARLAHEDGDDRVAAEELKPSQDGDKGATVEEEHEPLQAEVEDQDDSALSPSPQDDMDVGEAGAPLEGATHNALQAVGGQETVQEEEQEDGAAPQSLDNDEDAAAGEEAAEDGMAGKEATGKGVDEALVTEEEDAPPVEGSSLAGRVRPAATDIESGKEVSVLEEEAEAAVEAEEEEQVIQVPHEVLRGRPNGGVGSSRSAATRGDGMDVDLDEMYARSKARGAPRPPPRRPSPGTSSASLRAAHKLDLNCDPLRTPDSVCCDVVQSVMHRAALKCPSKFLEPRPAAGRAAATRSEFDEPHVPAQAARQDRPTRAAVPPQERAPRLRQWSVTDLTEFEKQEQRKEEKLMKEREAERAKADKAARDAQQANRKRSTPREGDTLYVAWFSEPCELHHAEIEGCKPDAKPNTFYSRHPKQFRLMMLKRWAQSIVRLDWNARVMLLTDQTTEIPDFSSGCGLSEQGKAVMRDYDVQCTDFVEHFRADVDTRDMNLAKLQAVAELLDTELDRGWIGHVVLMDYDMLLLKNVGKAAFSHKFDIALTWKLPLVPKTHVKWMPIDTGVMYFHKDSRQRSIALLDELVKLFKAKFAEDLWWGDQMVFRHTMKDSLLPPDAGAAWTNVYKSNKFLFWPALHHNHDSIPLEVPQEDVFILHFKKVHQMRMKEYWDLLKTDSRLPTVELGEQVDTMYKHGNVQAKSHGIEPARKYFGRHSEVRQVHDIQPKHRRHSHHGARHNDEELEGHASEEEDDAATDEQEALEASEAQKRPTREDDEVETHGVETYDANEKVSISEERAEESATNEVQYEDGGQETEDVNPDHAEE